MKSFGKIGAEGKQVTIVNVATPSSDQIDPSKDESEKKRNRENFNTADDSIPEDLQEPMSNSDYDADEQFYSSDDLPELPPCSPEDLSEVKTVKRTAKRNYKRVCSPASSSESENEETLDQ